jgi:hypothetical protein
MLFLWLKDTMGRKCHTELSIILQSMMGTTAATIKLRGDEILIVLGL